MNKPGPIIRVYFLEERLLKNIIIISLCINNFMHKFAVQMY